MSAPESFTDWRQEARGLASLGSQAERPGSLAGLAAARRGHLGQFFTPEPLARWVWRMLTPAMVRARAEHAWRRVSILDVAVGNGSLLRYADPEQHAIAGIDVDERLTAALAHDAKAAGFADYDFSAAGMEACHPARFGVAVLNPPFSLPLASPHLLPLPSTTWATYGPNTGALSHAYALELALEAAQIVAAILPSSYARSILDAPEDWPRLVAAYDAPPGSFREEGTEVAVSLLFFDREPRAPGRAVPHAKLARGLVAAPDLGLTCSAETGGRLRVQGIEDSTPTITRAVTGDKRVRVAHAGARVVLQFGCGFTEARVRNAILQSRLLPRARDEDRIPPGVRYSGQGALDLETHLIQDDPVASFAALLDTIRGADAEVDCDPGVWDYLRRRARRLRIERTPLRHTVLVPGDAAAGAANPTGTARETHLANPEVWGSPVIQAGQSVAFRRGDDGLYHYKAGGQDFTLSEEEVNRRYAISHPTVSGDRWETVHPGRLEAFPDHAAALRARAVALGLDRFLTRQYQLDDLLELAMARGGIAAWDVGLGKARLAVALVLLGSDGPGLVCTEPYLIPELVRELEALPIPRDAWQVIGSPEDADHLRRVNLISYNRLRAAVPGGRARDTYARRMRRRLSVVVADEGDILRHRNTAQTRALWMLSARRRYILTATPAANYPRDLFNLLAWTGGDATAAQPYGMRRWFLEPALRHYTDAARRGVDVIADSFVTVQWVTHEWRDALDAGAKREIPRLRNIQSYRDAIAPHILRRVAAEPEVARYFSMPVPVESVATVPWDDAHLAYYLEIAEEFREWYLNLRDPQSRSLNLVAILARIQAVQIAAAVPQQRRDGSPFVYRGGLTSKQRWAVDRLAELAAQGHKVVAFAEFPAMLQLVAAALAQRGIEAVTIHGGIDIRRRTEDMNTRFRFGPAPVLLASLGVAQKGLNLYQADRALFLTRAWTAKTERQAGGRLLRPQQTRDVAFEYAHLEGSIDLYQAQMVAAKADAIRAGLDWGTPESDDVEFLHIDTILHRFVTDLADLLGCKTTEIRQRLAA